MVEHNLPLCFPGSQELATATVGTEAAWQAVWKLDPVWRCGEMLGREERALCI